MSWFGKCKCVSPLTPGLKCQIDTLKAEVKELRERLAKVESKTDIIVWKGPKHYPKSIYDTAFQYFGVNQAVYAIAAHLNLELGFAPAVPEKPASIKLEPRKEKK